MDMAQDITAADPARLVARRAPTLGHDAAGRLTLDGVALAPLAAAHGTPLWVYGADTMRARALRLADALAPLGIGRADIHYAVKANDHLAVLSLLGALGLGADVVSGGELERAVAAGIPPERIVFAGVGKTEDELARAVGRGVGCVNAESLEELRTLSAIAAQRSARQTVMLRVNPDVDAGTHDKISTGRAGDKFGIAHDAIEAAYAEAAALPGLRVAGLAFHIGSQVMEGTPFGRAATVVASLAARLRARGLPVEAVDCGGGLGIGYATGPDGDPSALAGALGAAFGGAGLRLSVEPGRWIVGPAGVLVASVVRRKEASPRPFLVLDAAMNDLARPALYGAWHGIVPLEGADARLEAQDVVGPVCESSDVLAVARPLPRLASGEKVAILDAGAYGAVMSSTYNARPLAAQVLVDGGRHALIRRRQAVEALWRDEIVPA